MYIPYLLWFVSSCFIFFHLSNAFPLHDDFLHFLDGNATIEDLAHSKFICLDYNFSVDLLNSQKNPYGVCSRKKRHVVPKPVLRRKFFVPDSTHVKEEEEVGEAEKKSLEDRISAEFLKVVLDPNYLNVKDFNLMRFKTFQIDFNVPDQFVDVFWNIFDVSTVCQNNALVGFRVCGDKNPSRTVGVLHKTFPHGRVQTGSNGHVYLEYDVPPFVVKTKNLAKFYADLCKHQDDRYLCTVSTRCSTSSFEDCGVRAHVMTNGVFVENFVEGTFIAAVAKTYQLWTNESFTEFHMPASGTVFLQIKRGSYLIINQTVIDGHHSQNSVRHIATRINIPDLTHEDLDSFHKDKSHSTEKIEQLRVTLGRSFFGNIWFQIKSFFNTVFNYVHFIVVALGTFVLIYIVFKVVKCFFF